jgi:GIY-YIG catalytic domain-containing protein
MNEQRNRLLRALDRYRDADVPSIKVDVAQPWDLQDDWDNSPMPHNDKPGIYCIFSADADLLYIGKASLDSCIYSRVVKHVGPNDAGPGRVARPGDHWSKPPRILISVAVEKAYHAPSLEEWLIGELNPSTNDRRPRRQGEG